MKVMAINGSPRKNWNTAQLLESAIKGAQSMGAETELVSLYDLRYTGCISCFACKRKVTKEACRCYIKDELAPVLEKVLQADVLFLGSPIYLGDVTAAIRGFLERLAFCTHSYDDHTAQIFPGCIHSAFFFTMNGKEDIYKQLLRHNTDLLKRLGGSTEYYVAENTLQFDDYSHYRTAAFDAEAKKAYHELQFPKDLAAAFEIGVRLCSKAKADNEG